MTTRYSSKHGIIARSPMEMYMAFTDLRNLNSMLPKDDKRLEGVTINTDFDNLTINANNMTFSAKVSERQPYSKLVIDSVESPIKCSLTLNFKENGGSQTEFFIELDAELNFLMKSMIGKKIEEGLNKIIDTLESQNAQI